VITPAQLAEALEAAALAVALHGAAYAPIFARLEHEAAQAEARRADARGLHARAAAIAATVAARQQKGGRHGRAGI